MTLSPADLVLAWYWTEPPDGWVYGHGDVCGEIPYVVRDVITGQILVEPVLAVCTEHPCDTANDPSARVDFCARLLAGRGPGAQFAALEPAARRGSRPSL